MKLLLSFFGLWITPICHSGDEILLPEFGHQIPAALLNRFISGGGARVFDYRPSFKQMRASINWRGHELEYFTDDWGGAVISGPSPALETLFAAMAKSPRTRVRVIED